MRRLLLGILAVCGGLAAGAPSAHALTTTPTTAPYIVVLKSSATSLDLLRLSYGIVPKHRYSAALKGFAADLNATQLSRIKADPAVAFVEPDATVQATGMVPLAAGEVAPPGVRRMGGATTTQAHAAANPNVAVIDSGIDPVNTDLVVSGGINCVKPGTPPSDDNGHGTHVAGSLAARNGSGPVVGVAPGTRLYAVKVLGATGSGTVSQLLCGLDWVTQNAAALNIKVVSMSLVGGGADDGACGSVNADSEHKAICAATNAGVTFVVAAGNNAARIAGNIPAAYPEVLTVTAMSDTDGLAGGKGAAPACLRGQLDDGYATYSAFASTAAELAHTIAAPGTCVVSDKPGGGTATYYGTSMAAPHVAGAVALCLGSAGLPGPCAGLTPAQTIAKVRADAQAGATTLNGFTGDPLHPVTGRLFGYLVRADSY